MAVGKTNAAKEKDDEEGSEIRKVTKEEAAFILGSGGKTKAKLSTVSGATIDLVEGKGDKAGPSQLEIRGTAVQRKRARKYIEFVIGQRLGPVKIDDPSAHDDLRILPVPADTVSFITGRQGSFLRLVEEEWGTLLFFLQVDPKNPRLNVDPNHMERLAIFGPQRARRGAELKVMAAAEMKRPGCFTKNSVANESAEESFATDIMIIAEDDYSYALGKGGSTRRKLARASNCIVEYVGHCAYFSGLKAERRHAREYLQWLLLQRVGELAKVDHGGREDVSVVMVQASCIGFVTGHRGQALRAVEEETSTFCFIEGSVGDGEDTKPLLIFGRLEDRRLAETLVRERIWKVVEEYDGNGSGGRKGGKKGKGKGGKYGRDAKGYDAGYGTGDTEREPPRAIRKDVPSEFQNVSDDDAAFLMGPGGKTKKKIEAVSGAQLELKSNRLEIIGTDLERDKAKRYVKLVMAQRAGPVKLEDVEKLGDLSVVDVPADAVSFVTGKQGSFLRLVEEEFGTLLFFLDFSRTGRRDQPERLALFGPDRERRGAELKVMAAIEMKQPGHFTKADALLPLDPSPGFATDRMPIDEDDYSYALGKGGATRKKIARASGCVIEYIGRLAYLSGSKDERTHAREYLGWLFQQRVGPVEVNYAGRADVTVVEVPKDCVGFVTGHKGTSLRAVEDATGTFCFIEGGREDPQRDPKPLLVFGNPEARRCAEERLRERIDQKVTEGWVHEDGSGHGKGGWGGGKYGKGGKGYDERPPKGGGYSNGYGRGGADKGTWSASGKGGVGAAEGGFGSGARSAGAPAPTPAAAPAEPEDEGIWGDWGGSSDDDAGKAAAAAPTAPPMTSLAVTSTPSVASEPRGGGWSQQHYSAAAGAYAADAGSYGGAGGASAGNGGGEDFSWQALPPQLLHEEAWPEMGGTQSKKKRAGRGGGTTLSF